MSTDVSTFSPAKLWGLSRGATIAVRYVPSDGSDGLIICPNLPKAAAVQFSSRWGAAFPPQLNRKDLYQFHPRELQINGGGREQAEEILGWIVRCCTHQGFKQYRIYRRDDKPFTRYFDLRNTAQDIGCHYLVIEFTARMDRLLECQVHSEDVRAMFMKAENHEIPHSSEVLDLLANHIAIHIFDQTLKAKSAYDTLRYEMVGLNTRVESHLLPLIRARKASNHAEKQAVINEKRRAHQEERAQHFNSTHSADASEVTVDEKGDLRTNIACPLKSKGRGGRPDYYELPLPAVGVGKGYLPVDYKGAKTPARFRHQKQSTQVDATEPAIHEKDESVDNLTNNMTKVDITNKDVNHKGVGGRFVPGATNSISVQNKKQRQRAKKRAEKEGKKEADEKVGERAEATAE